MNDHIKKYWTEAHKKYSERGFVAKPTIFVEEIIALLPQSGVLLDLGAGQGQDSRFFASRGYEVTSTDLTPHPLEVSKKLAEEGGLRIHFREIDLATMLPFEDGVFDIVYSHLALHYFDAKTTEQIFWEIHRVLKPMGVCAILLNTLDDSELRRNDFEKIEEAFYKTPSGIYKRFFSTESLTHFTEGLFDPILLDAHGRTHKDDIDTLIRFVGRKK